MDFSKHQVDAYYTYIQQQPAFPDAYATELFLIGKLTNDDATKQAIETTLSMLVSKEGVKALRSRTKIPMTGKPVDYEKTLKALISFGKKAQDLDLGKMFALLGYDHLMLTRAALIKRVNENAWIFGRLDYVKSFTIWEESFPSGMIPDEIGELKGLEELDIRGGYTALPDGIGNLQQLKKLELRLSNLTALPDSIRRLTQLEELKIAGSGSSRDGFNKHLTLPSWMADFKHLKKLELGYLTLQEIPTNLFPPQLEELRLYRMHHLTALPDSIGALEHLTSFELYVCDHITALPKSMVNLHHLEVFEIGSLPNLTSLDGNLVFSPNLKKIRLPDGVQITEPERKVNHIKELIVRNKAYLMHLVNHPDLFPDLETLKIYEVKEWDSIKGLNGLQQLHTLSVWQLGDVPALFGDLATCPALRHLELSNSALTTLPDLRAVPQLAFFKIHYCDSLHLFGDRLPECIDRLDLSSAHTFTFGNLPLRHTVFRISNTHLENFEAMGRLLDAQEVNLSCSDHTTIDGQDVLQTLPSSIGQMKNLVEFSFQGKVVEMNDCFHPLKKLESLSLSGLTARYRSNGKDCLIEHMVPLQLPQLRHLFLSDYAGDQLAEILAPLTQLQSLGFRQIGHYEVLPVATMTALEEVQLYQCGFSDLSEVAPTIQVFDAYFCENIGNEAVATLCTWSRLKKLSLKYISKTVTTLPDCLQQLPLTLLDLNHLNLKEIPAFIGHIKTLNTLCLDGYYIDGLPLSIADLPALEYLSINATTFKQALPDDFQRLQIKELRMFLSKFAGNNMREELYAALLTPGLTKVVKGFSPR